jgi:hypothetical protein
MMATWRNSMLRSITAVGVLLLAASNVWGLGQEHVGNEPLADANYTNWPNVMPVINDTHRVYHRWVNGNEHFFFKGDTLALNTVLKKFAAIEADRLTVVLRPAPGKTSSFLKDRTFTFNWNLHLLGGIAKHMSTLEFGSNIWDPNPYLHVYVGDAIKLDEIEIPEGVKVLEIANLQIRYAKCLASSNQTVRGWSCGEIARLDPYDSDAMRKIAARLDDQVDWVKLNAAGALSQFTSTAEEVIEKLQAVRTDDKQLQERITTSIESLRKVQPNQTARKEYQQLLASIHAFVVSRRKAR